MVDNDFVARPVFLMSAERKEGSTKSRHLGLCTIRVSFCGQDEGWRLDELFDVRSFSSLIYLILFDLSSSAS